MRAVVQRVKNARVEIEQKVAGEIGRGLLIFLGVGADDTEKDCDYLASKTAHLRIFADENGRMNRSVSEISGSILVVSQFTLWADCRKGRRPSFIAAAAPDKAVRLYEYFIGLLRGRDLNVAAGRFQEMMDVHLINDGPVTILLDSRKFF